MQPSHAPRWTAARAACVAAAALATGAAIAQVAAPIPDLLFEVDLVSGARTQRPEALWVSASRAFPNGGLAGGYFKRGSHILAFQQTTEATEGPFAGESRDSAGECRYTYVEGGGPRSFETYREYLDASAMLLAGTIEDSVVGFALGNLATFYALRVDTVLKGSNELLGEIVWVPHLTVSLRVNDQEVCFNSPSYPHAPSIGKRASIGVPRQPMRLVGAEADHPVFLAGAYVEGWFWFQRPDGGAYVPGLENVIDPPTWARVERRLQALGQQR